MNAQMQLKDVTSIVLDYQAFAKDRLSPLYEFFQFWRYPRTFSNPKELLGITFSDLGFQLEPPGVPQQPFSAGLRIFARLFPDIIARLMGSSL